MLAWLFMSTVKSSRKTHFGNPILVSFACKLPPYNLYQVSTSTSESVDLCQCLQKMERSKLNLRLECQGIKT